MNVAAANSARRPASNDGEKSICAKLTAAATIVAVAAAVTRSTSLSTPGSSDATFALTSITTPLSVGRGRAR